MLEEVLLLSGNDIPFFSAKINLHQPTVNEISFIGEENFFMGCQLLNFSKDVLSEEDRLNLADTDDFNILMSIVCDEDATAQKACAAMVLSLIFPEHEISFNTEGIHLVNGEDSTSINIENYQEFKGMFQQMFGLNLIGDEDYKPKNEAARKIAEKLKKGRAKVAQLQGTNTEKVAILSRYVSILAIGLRMDINLFLNHTVYQVYDEFKRFQLLQTFDINLRARMAGASDLEEVDNWMGDLYP